MSADPTVAPDLLGYAASLLVFLAFWLRSMPALRAVAIASNVLFIAYALYAQLNPVLVLHAALLPLNIWRLWQCLGGPRRGARSLACSTPSASTPAVSADASKADIWRTPNVSSTP